MRKFFSFLFTILIIGGLAFWAWQHPEFCQKQADKIRAMWYVYKGDKALKKLKIQRAIKYYLDAVRLYPGHYGAWYNLGNIYVVYEDYYSAVDAYEEAFEHNPKMIVAKMNYGVVSAEKLGDFDGAINQYNDILKTKRTLITIPFVYSNRRSYKMNRGIAYYNMGVAYKQKSIFHTNNYEERKQYLFKALKSYKEACKILKKDYDAKYNLALTYHILGNYKEAGLGYCDAIYINPMRYEAHYNLAILLRHFKYYKESYEELEKAATLIETGPNGISAQQRYIFDVMNDVTRTVLATEDNDLIQKFFTYDATDDIPPKITYVHGRMILSKDLDKAILKNFQVCNAKSIILEELDDSSGEIEDVSLDIHIPGEEDIIVDDRIKHSPKEEVKEDVNNDTPPEDMPVDLFGEDFDKLFENTPELNSNKDKKEDTKQSENNEDKKADENP